MARIALLLVIGVGTILAMSARDGFPEPVPIPLGPCVDADGDGYCIADDCNDADPNCNVDCTDADGDGFCLPYDCDDGTPDVSDMDQDGVPDACDNCPATANRWQEDFDGFEPQQVISDTANGVSVFAADLDGDTDLDVLSALSVDDTIAWYENLDGAGSFGPQQVITAEADSARSVYAADLDGDTDLDVLSASVNDDKVAWYENLDGAGSFGPQHVITATADGARSVYAADLDGDTDLDVLVASSWDDTIAWYENLNGAGHFGSRQVITAAADSAWSVYAADLDGDTDLDVLTASWGDDTVAWYENLDGAGNFGSQQVISDIVDGVRSVYAADLDGDMDLDVLSASSSDDKIAWYENLDGAGDFGLQRVIATPDLANSVFVADVDGDGDPDVLSASIGDDTIAWYRNQDGTGNFGPQRVITATADGAVFVYAADLNGDADLDVLSASTNDDTIAWYPSNGADGFGDACDNCPDDSNPGQQDADLDGVGDSCDNCPAAPNDDQADADGDGAGDACDICPNDPQDDLDGDGVCGDEDNCPDDSNSGQEDTDLDGVGDACDNCPATPNAGQADTDGDGVGDACDGPCIDGAGGGDDDDDGFCAVDDCNDADPNCNIDCTDADGDGFCPPYDCDDTLPHPSDLDGDGVPDVCDNCPATSNPQQRDFDGFRPEQLIHTSGAAVSVFGADLDGDSDVDVLSAGFAGIAWSENLDGAGGFGPKVAFDGTGNDGTSVFAADLDGDMDLDVLSATRTDHKIAWHENLDGTGTFGPQQVITVEAFAAQSVYAADLNGDSYVDVLSASEFDDKIAWYENLDGTGSFGPQRVITTEATDAADVLAADLDGDSDLDVISASLSPGAAIAWYENLNGLGEFGPPQPIAGMAEANGPWDIFAADLDGDSDLDLLSATIWDDKIAWYENRDGLGDFGPQIVISTAANSARSVFAADLDGDSDLDVIEASYWDGSVAWYENLFGVGGFGPRRVITTDPTTARSVFAADLDGDSDVDVISASWFDGKITWYRNLEPDGFGDACDNCPDARNPGQPDFDLDGVGDICDNCPLESNASQTNSDGDANGNACDCSPNNYTVGSPAEVRFLLIENLGSGSVELDWTEVVPNGERYSVTRVELSALGANQYGDCLIAGLSNDNTYIDDDVPLPGAGYGYLIRAEDLTCGFGPLGYTSGGGLRVNVDPDPCP